MIRKPLLFIPGPMIVPDVIRAAADRPLFPHRSQQMLDLLSKLEQGLRPIFGTAGDILFLASSGSGAMESAVANLTSPGEEVVVMVGGNFAERWQKINEAYGVPVRAVAVDPRRGATADDVARALDRHPAAKVVFVTWSESSTAVLLDLESIGRTVRQREKVLVADGVSALAISPLQMDAWGVDAVVVGSQKGLMLPPGLGLVAVGQRAWERAEAAKSPRFYWDWARYKGAVPFTPAMTLLFQLDAALDFIHAQGIEKIFERRACVAQKIRELVVRNGFELYAERPGNGVTAVLPPPAFDIDGFRRRLDRDFGIPIAGGQGALKGKIFRIGHVGHVTDEELDYLASSFEKALKA